MSSLVTGGLAHWDAQCFAETFSKATDTQSSCKVEKTKNVPQKTGKDSSEDKNQTVSSSCETTTSSSVKETSSNANSSTDVKDGFMLGPGLLNVINRPGAPLAEKSTLSLEEKVKLALSCAEECVQPAELENLFQLKEHPICYDGFEPSGRMHIAQGVLKALIVNKLTKCGCVFVFWVADYFAFLNNKMDGDLAKIKRVGEYFIEVWKAAGMNMNNVRFLWTSEEINRDPNNYYLRVFDIARGNTISRVKRCGQIMGRGEGDDQPVSQMMYPCMQCADIFYIGADICQLGMDQRKVNMLAREYAEMKNAEGKKNKDRKLHKPIILSHGMMAGLLEGQAKMSKSNPDSAIFVEDSPEEVRRKIKKAFCPPEILEENPCAQYVESLVFGYFGKFVVKRSEKNGGDITYATIEEFRASYVKGELHPGDLKASLAECLNEILQPIRDHFKNDANAKAILSDIQKYKTQK